MRTGLIVCPGGPAMSSAAMTPTLIGPRFVPPDADTDSRHADDMFQYLLGVDVFADYEAMYGDRPRRRT
jgi:hypothetical protein